MALKPKNWPLHLTYISAPKYSPQLSKDQAKALTVCPDSLIKVPDEICRLPSTQAKIVPISDAKHPANGQAGLFATKNLKPGAPILLYLGIVHPPDTAHETSDYDLWLDHDLEIAVDAATTGNEARFINDYRGVKQRPNAEFREVWSLAAQLGSGLTTESVMQQVSAGHALSTHAHTSGDPSLRSILPQNETSTESHYTIDESQIATGGQHLSGLPTSVTQDLQYGQNMEHLGRKRPKASRACDECRRKKIKCDAQLDTGTIPCTNCRRGKALCLFSRVPQKRGPNKGYIRELADRISGIEDKLVKERSLKRPCTDIASEDDTPFTAGKENVMWQLSDTSTQAGVKTVLSTPTLVYLQTLLLLAVQADNRPVGEHGVDKTEILGRAVSTALSAKIYLGHHPAEGQPDDTNRTMRIRIWWCLVIMDRWHAIGFGTQSLIREEYTMASNVLQGILPANLYHLARLNPLLNLAGTIITCMTDLPASGAKPHPAEIALGSTLIPWAERFREDLPPEFTPATHPTLFLVYWHARLLAHLLDLRVTAGTLVWPCRELVAIITSPMHAEHNALLTALTRHAIVLTSLVLRLLERRGRTPVAEEAKRLETQQQQQQQQQQRYQTVVSNRERKSLERRCHLA
ncbi:Glucose transport transcription regulator RGT1 [Ceratocystis platani]|uniref:Glucose transport transcription regulator RGT1 n=1 Tax=Ceratocystis fimbriata f. sp. platani TaxID=88771 RepID=A0A0F8B7X6_CERFI|nr:Glucose transport transcription regulator RGT1 [Ceratocystis platani]